MSRGGSPRTSGHLSFKDWSTRLWRARSRRERLGSYRKQNNSCNQRARPNSQPRRRFGRCRRLANNNREWQSRCRIGSMLASHFKSIGLPWFRTRSTSPYTTKSSPKSYPIHPMTESGSPMGIAGSINFTESAPIATRTPFVHTTKWSHWWTTPRRGGCNITAQYHNHKPLICKRRRRKSLQTQISLTGIWCWKRRTLPSSRPRNRWTIGMRRAWTWPRSCSVKRGKTIKGWLGLGWSQLNRGPRLALWEILRTEVPLAPRRSSRHSRKPNKM